MVRGLWIAGGAAAALLLGGAALLPRPGQEAGANAAPVRPAVAARTRALAPADRRPYFGELHLHTIMSFDAWTFGTKVTPDEAYRFARGETVMISPIQLAQQQGVQSNVPVPARRAWALDFAAVTDHAEYLGAVAQLENPDSAFSKSKIGQLLKAGGRGAFFTAGEAIRGINNEYTADFRAAAKEADGWSVELRAANANNQPGRFTTLVGYEFTSTPGRGVHMHRNVFFNSDNPPAPFTSVDSNRPEDLWTYMEGVRAKGIEVLAIPHNSNLSDGREFDLKSWDGRPIDRAYAARQQANEPLVEIAQTKGTSETTPQLSPNDEFAGFEVMDRIYAGETESKQHGSYVREGLGRGLALQAQVGVNPFKMGLVGGSDIHNGLSVSDEAGSASASNGLDPRTMSPKGGPLRRALGEAGDATAVRPNGQRENDPLQMSSAGITGVWAEENTRPAIFAALKRKETFATSGTRIKVRIFGGWDFTPASLKRPDWVTRAYATGAPMGADLPARRPGAAAPRFIVQAMKDPGGANLDRVQIVKVWRSGEGYAEKVFDVALPAAKGGAASLITVWTDPSFDPKVESLYYARVLEVPTPRWTTLLAGRNGLPPPKGAPATIQERAWTSPIWYGPR